MPPPSTKRTRKEEGQSRPGAPEQSTLKDAAARTLESDEILFGAIENFIRENAVFESSIPINAAIEEMAACTDLQSVFLVPISRQLLSMEGALLWIHFLVMAPEHAAEEAAADEGNGGAPFGELDAVQAHKTLSNIYDVGAETNVWTHFDSDFDDDDDDSDADSDDVTSEDDAAAAN